MTKMLENMTQQEIDKLKEELAEREKARSIDVNESMEIEIEIREKHIEFPMRIKRGETVETKTYIVTVSKEKAMKYMQLFAENGIEVDNIADEKKIDELVATIEKSRKANNLYLKFINLLVDDKEFANILFAQENTQVLHKIINKIGENLKAFF